MDRYEQVCFSLKQKEDELNALIESAPVDLFVLNSNLVNLTNEIKNLKDEKKALEEKE